MVAIVISRTTLQLLLVRKGAGMRFSVPRDVDGGRVEIDVELDVFEQLRLIHPDPDQAIHTLCTTGVGRA